MKTKVYLRKFFQRAIVASSVMLLAGCATTKDNVDPYEKYNRAVFKFNRSVDYAVARPIADLYDTLTPAPIQGGVGRMFTNFYEPSRVINDILQGEMRYAYQDSTRFLLNSTVGFAGFFDIAERIGYPVHQQDFGITMARWGWKQSAYLVMPILGVYTVRDFTAVPFNTYVFTFWPYIQPENLAWNIYFLEKAHTRAVLRPADKVIDEAFDPYLLVRDAYLQKRKESIDIQRSGRTAEVKPAAEQADEQPVAKGNAPATENTGKQGISATKSTQRGSGKNLPDIISLETNKSNSRTRMADTEESEIIG